MSNYANVAHFVQRMNVVWFELRFRKDFLPVMFSGVEGLFGARNRGAAFERAPIGEISLEMSRIDDDALDRAGLAKFQYRPVVARAAAPARFPAVAHVFSAARHEHISRRA